MQKESKYIEIKFHKIWKHIRISRQTKETVKHALFSKAPFLFSKLSTYQHWKNAQVFVAANNSGAIFPQYSVKDNIVLDVTKLAVVFHVFYLDVFKHMLSILLGETKVELSFFITCPGHLHNDIETTLKDIGFQYKIVIVKNHGRDILPFLKILPIVIEQDFDIVLKIHTKRSNHLNKKDLWSTDLFEKLLKNGAPDRLLSVFSKNPNVGMIGPEGHLLPMSLYYGGNALKVEKLSLEMGLEKEQLQNLIFVAGSMFYARKEALLPVLKLGLTELDFEDEDQQLDNTTAHAVERVFASGLRVSKFKLVDSSSNINNLTCQITLEHPYTI